MTSFLPKSLKSQGQSEVFRHPLRWLGGLVLVTVFLVIVFRTNPQFEIAISAAYFTELACGAGRPIDTNCGWFFYRESEVWQALRYFAYRLPLVIGVLSLAWVAVVLADRPARPFVDIEKPLVGLLSLLIGPFLIINMVMKPFFGRPRPSETSLFTDTDIPYVLPGSISDYCSGNCSFVSGEAGSIFWLFWLILLLPVRWRLPFAIVLFFTAFGFSFLRVMFGSHFLSDIMVGGLVGLGSVCFTTWMLQTNLVRDRIETWLAAISRPRG